MAIQHNSSAPAILDMDRIDFLSVLDRLDDGVIITDLNGIILFYNKAQSKIDDIPLDDAMGRNVTDIYELNCRTSMVMQCITHKASLKNKTFFYRTCSGKVINSITSCYPLYTKGQINGAICFVKDYELLRRSTPMPSRDFFHTNVGNGTRFRFTDIIGSSHQLKEIISIAQRAADSPSPIMIQGETGTGKELFAQSIHNHGPRREKKFIAINCAAIPHDLLEGMLFGTRKGAFTGALDKPGLFEMAHGSTIFLDELLAMPVNLQAKLLRVLQDKRVRRLGSSKEIQVDVKIISSVNQNPRTSISEKKLRTDLYYRLGVVIIKIPPLSQRLDSMGELVGHFIKKYNTRLGTNVKTISKEVMELFHAYQWPGNIRELEHLIEGAMNMVGQEGVIGMQHFGPGLDGLEKMDPACYDPETVLFNALGARIVPSVNDTAPLVAENFIQAQKQQEETAIKKALHQANGNVTQAAITLGISRQLLHYKLKKLKVRRIDFIRDPKP